MRLFLLTALTMVAFAANSVLNRAAVAGGGIGAVDFATLRLLAGAAVLAVLVLTLRRGLRVGGAGRLAGVGGLLLYLFGFSWAYQALDAGLGALILFGTVQVTMFAGALAGGERPGPRVWAGAAVALAGLAWLLWPAAGLQISVAHGLAMVAAGAGWGVYSLAGRRATDPLMATAANFVLAAPVGLALAAALPGAGAVTAWQGPGIALALASGAVASGLGYALWYSVLPQLSRSGAAVAQLSVPVLAIAGGAAFLGEPLSAGVVLSAAIVLGGVALASLPVQRSIGSSGS